MVSLLLFIFFFFFFQLIFYILIHSARHAVNQTIYPVIFKATGQAICNYYSISCEEGQQIGVSQQPPYFPGSQTAPLNERFLTSLLVIKG